MAVEPTSMSILSAGTLYNSVKPRPVRPTVPKENDSSKMRRYLYFCFSSIYTGVSQ